MIQKEKFTHLIAGAGPTGLAVLEELLENDVDLSEIALIDMNLDRALNLDQAGKRSRDSILSISSRERATKGLGKSGSDVLGSFRSTLNGTFSWGTSCLAPKNFVIGTEKATQVNLKEDYTSVMISWGVQGESKPICVDFPISGEVVDRLSRKEYANTLVEESSFFIHSRLALQLPEKDDHKGCHFLGNCFSGCPNNAPWNSAKKLKELKLRHPKLNMFNVKIESINVNLKQVKFEDGVLSYDKLYLSTGARTTQSLIEKSIGKSLKLHNTPVALLPIVLPSTICDSDYKGHFVYADLIMPLENQETKALVQIYLPTTEISGRIMAQFPKILANLLSKKIFFKSSLKRVGIAMIFLEQSIILPGRQTIHNNLNQVLPIFRKKMKAVNIRVLKYPSVFLLNGQSEHLGALAYEWESKFGIESELFRDLAGSGIYITDTCCLPEIPPGPHTATAAALARFIVRQR